MAKPLQAAVIVAIGVVAASVAYAFVVRPELNRVRLQACLRTARQAWDAECQKLRDGVCANPTPRGQQRCAQHRLLPCEDVLDGYTRLRQATQEATYLCLRLHAAL